MVRGVIGVVARMGAEITDRIHSLCGSKALGW